MGRKKREETRGGDDGKPKYTDAEKAFILEQVHKRWAKLILGQTTLEGIIVGDGPAEGNFLPQLKELMALVARWQNQAEGIGCM